MPGPLPVILIVGPTAGGKTALSIELARRLPGGGECVCADSMQVYRGMDIGTAKPTAAERALVPHHLLDLLEPAERGFSVDRWLELARTTIDDIRRRGRHAIVVGGTNLYIQSLLYGLTDGPPPDEDLRQRLREEPEADLRRRLERVDPVSAERIHRRDTKRTVRALEVHELTGRPMSEQMPTWADSTPRPDVMLLGLEYDPASINRRINRRVRAMIETGLVEEVAALRGAGGLGPQAAEALGYRQIAEVIEGRRTLADAAEEIKVRSRRLAKQQRTWLRRFRALPGSVWLDADRLSPQNLVEQSLTAIAVWTPQAASAAPTRPRPPAETPDDA